MVILKIRDFSGPIQMQPNDFKLTTFNHPSSTAFGTRAIIKPTRLKCK